MNAAETIQTAIDRLEGRRDAAEEEDGMSWDVHSPATGALTVMLHRTIDAQLTILRASLRDPAMTGHGIAALRLARAILGEAS